VRRISRETLKRAQTPSHAVASAQPPQGAAAHADAVRAVPSEMLFAWLGPVLRAPDDDALLAELGVDSVLYIKLTRLCLHLLLATALFDLTAVLAANVAGAHLVRGPESDLGRLTMAHVPPGSPTLWVHFFSVLLKTGVLVALTYRVRARACGRAAARSERTDGCMRVTPALTLARRRSCPPGWRRSRRRWRTRGCAALRAAWCS
jgi:hypothetical protein